MLVLSFTIFIVVVGTVASPLLLLSQSAFAQQASFDNPVPLDTGPGTQTRPHVIASDGSNVYVAYTRSVSNDQEGEAFSFLNAIAANGDTVYVTWTRVTDVASIYLAKSTNGGVTFGMT